MTGDTYLSGSDLFRKPISLWKAPCIKLLGCIYSWGWVELAAGVNAQPAGLPANTDSIEFTLATMAQTGQTTARIQAYGLTPSFALQTAPGKIHIALSQLLSPNCHVQQVW